MHRRTPLAGPQMVLSRSEPPGVVGELEQSCARRPDQLLLCLEDHTFVDQLAANGKPSEMEL